jgi:hypothetical protein
MLDEESLAKGRRDVSTLLETYAECTNAGEWPAYSNTITTLSLPTWA